MSSNELIAESPPEVEPTEPVTPAIWVGTAGDYAAERRYGGWVSAAQPTGELRAEIGRIIDRTPDGLGQEWNVCELRGFGLWQPTDTDGLPAIVQVARGIGLYGLPYSGLVAAIGADHRGAALDRFPQTYLGDWPTLAAFAEQVITESGWYEELARLPRSMREYVRFDVEKLQRSARKELTVVGHAAGVWVYDPRMW